MKDARESYRDYYKEQATAIGGDERFTWVMQEILKDVSGKKVLDVGCGEGTLLRMLRDAGNEVQGVDAAQTGKDLCVSKGLPCEVVDISRGAFPLADDAFDVVLCLETLEHLENPYHCISEIKRVLKKGGMFVASIPNPKSLHGYIYPGLFEFDNFEAFLELNGFKVTRQAWWGQNTMFNGLSRRLAACGCTWGQGLERFIYYLSRKRNAFLRNHCSTPRDWCWSLNFVCVNEVKHTDVLHEIAVETTPSDKRRS
ncbi:MAG: class I SAM-dependent methyltransferase [Candidatus Omnitrophica bacterium]|nr:class I SAM-dependent methyltransferase [Candidatus Omnitrophota bacterium]